MGPKKLWPWHCNFFQGISSAHTDDRILARQSLYEDPKEGWTGKDFGDDFVGAANAATVTAGKFFQYPVRHLSERRQTDRYSGSSIIDSSRVTTTTPFSVT